MEGRARLRPDEARVYSLLAAKTSALQVAALSAELGIDESALAPLLHSLVQRGLAKITEKEIISAIVTTEGKRYAENELPERRLLKTILGSGGKALVPAARSLSHLTDEEVQIALGWARKKNWIRLERSGSESVLIAEADRPEGEDERLLREISKGVFSADKLTGTEKEALESLRSRGLLQVSSRVERTVEPTDLARRQSLQEYEVVEELGKLTSALLKNGEWRSKKLREYDVSASPPAIYPGRRHPYLSFLDEVRELLIGMGFSEDEGSYVETEFWNFDTLFVPQDHPAREIQDVYRVSQPGEGKLVDPRLAQGVKKAHESTWGYKWNAEIARRLVLRSHTTVVSVRHLYGYKKPPLKMFCLSRNFRRDLLNPTHSMEFFQCEGIVMDKGLSFRDLLGFFTEFAHKLGLHELRFRPTYFPYTEPSVEGFVKHPKLGWLEMLPGGLFRPELLKPLGIKYPVLAWGIGIDRIAMAALGIADIRELYGTGLQTVRDASMAWNVCRR